MGRLQGVTLNKMQHKEIEDFSVHQVSPPTAPTGDLWLLNGTESW